MQPDTGPSLDERIFGCAGENRAQKPASHADTRVIRDDEERMLGSVLPAFALQA
jgi:hypothetical protein